MAVKKFVAFDYLTAADVNDYLMEQSVMVLPGTGAIGSAGSVIGTGATATIAPAEGMFVYLTDLNQYQMNLDGSATGWYPVAGQMPMAVYKRTTAQSIPNDNTTSTKLTFPTATVSRTGISYSSGDFTVTYAGMYVISYWALFGSSTVGRRLVSVYVNGSSVVGDNRSAAVNGAGNVNIATNQYLAAGDVVSFYALQNSGGAINMDSATVTISYVGP